MLPGQAGFKLVMWDRREMYITASTLTSHTRNVNFSFSETLSQFTYHQELDIMLLILSTFPLSISSLFINLLITLHNTKCYYCSVAPSTYALLSATTVGARGSVVG
jgi:hypothetical protein